jgi:hypothetical protein
MARPRSVVALALAVALATVLPLQGGGENARAEVRSATGPLVATADGAVLGAEGLRPGDVRVGEVTVTNAGDTAGAFTLSQADRVDSPTPAGPLSSVLDLAVTDLTAGRVVFAGKLAAMASVALRDRVPGALHRDGSGRVREAGHEHASPARADRRATRAAQAIPGTWHGRLPRRRTRRDRSTDCIDPKNSAPRSEAALRRISSANAPSA